MILEDATYEAFGYYPSEHKHKSSKFIIAACELCGDFRVLQRHHYRHLCASCAQKGNTYALGCIHTEEANAKKSAARKGKTHTEVTKALMSVVHKGKMHTEDSKVLMHTVKTGEKHWNWQGGISFEPYCVKFDDAFKQLIRTKFNNKCFWCDMTTEENGRALDVHHVNYNKNCGCDETKCICVPLCKSCHSKTNTDRDRWQEKIMIKLKLSGILWEN